MRFKNINKFKKRIIISAVLSLFVYFLLVYIFTSNKLNISVDSYRASQKMAEAITVIKIFQAENNISINKKIDPNSTGLIGSKQSSLTTSLGHLEAKRTTTNPNFAGLIVYLLLKAGIQKGDRIAIGSSASFPALMIASVCAAEAMGVKPITILSLGSSSYGANHPEFNLLHIYELLYQKGVFSYNPSAISLGGEGDIGRGMNSSFKKILIRQIKKSKVPFIFENDFRKSVEKRLQIYNKEEKLENINAFINCGGNVANLGTSSLILKVKPGLIMDVTLPDKNKRGVLFEMASKGIPCIHLLYIQGLVKKYNLEWDPIPLPKPKGYSDIKQKKENRVILLILCFFYLVIIGYVFYK